MLRPLTVVAALAVLSAPVAAGEAAELLRQGLYDGERAGLAGELSELASAGDQEAQFALGFDAFVDGVEGLAGDLYRYGLAVPDPGAFGPALGMPLPANPAPEVLTYEGFRKVLSDFVDSMDDARETLLQAGEAGDYVVDIDVLGIRLDIDGNGTGEAGEVLATLLGLAAAAPGNPERPMRPPGGEAGSRADPAEAMPGALVVGFDRADAIWLAGYTQILAAQADFLLAHDFEATFDAAFHRLFPQAGLPMQDHTTGSGQLMMDPESDGAIADLIAAVHTFSWPVSEPDRLRRVRERMQAVTALSRQNWKAILAETDDHLELLPAPHQTPLLGAPVTEEMVAAWMEALDTTDSILAGELLLPHWRFERGIDLAAYFEGAERTDLVMLLTGHDALPFLADGPIASAESFAAANRVFGDRLPNYALWFN
ncbi:MAG TPA: hypothetical protein VGN80_03545 [Devosiaceae bacterium]|jgi:hypothetical protein|nr:hypothetical protein [Devosiaceae bacterium]